MTGARISKGLPDEVFVMRGHGICIRVADMIDAVNAAPDVVASWHATADLMALFRSHRINDNCIKRMTAERRDQPLLVLALPGESWVIDGNHRLVARSLLGIAETAAIVVPPDISSQCIDPLGF